MPTARAIRVGPGVDLGSPRSLFLIAGPCVIESRRHALFLAREIRDVCRGLRMPFVFKASYDKANRSSVDSFRGPGLREGLDVLRAVKDGIGVPVLSDVHETAQVAPAAEVVDILQIPAFLCRQTDLLAAAARTGRAVNLKKGQFLSPWDMRNVLDKVLAEGNRRVLLTERGASFGYNNLVLDVRSFPVMARWGFPVVVDASHAVQRPGGEGARSGGDGDLIPVLARAGVAAGADGLFLEVHENPAKALSDRMNSLRLDRLEDVLRDCLAVRRAVAAAAEAERAVPKTAGAGPRRRPRPDARRTRRERA